MNDRTDQTIHGAAARHAHKVIRAAVNRETKALVTKSMIDAVAAEMGQALAGRQQANSKLTALNEPLRDLLKKDSSSAEKMSALRAAQETAGSLRYNKGVSVGREAKLAAAPGHDVFFGVNPGLNILTPPWDATFFAPNPRTFRMSSRSEERSLIEAC